MPPAEPERVVAWRLGQAILAARLEDTVEIAAVAADGHAVGRTDRLELRTPPGLEPPTRPHHAVVVRVRGRETAMAADEVLGIQSYTTRDSTPLPPWLDPLPTAHLARLIRLPDDRIAALLDLDALGAS